MFRSLLSIFTKDPVKKLVKAKDEKYKKAVAFQRNGNLREYASIMQEISVIEEEILEIHRNKS